MVSRREELIFLGKNNPKLFWKELQASKKQTENNIQRTSGLSMQGSSMSRIEPPAPLVNIATIAKLFTVQEIGLAQVR